MLAVVATNDAVYTECSNYHYHTAGNVTCELYISIL
jgi:hypothetical protein